mmetsp:Transcript_14257/g.36466  ORF Transcript_14257/g.36466 Transcript_14257/m.36466 type:complete len:214 (-) Transcript_14257:930-1571(-)
MDNSGLTRGALPAESVVSSKAWPGSDIRFFMETTLRGEAAGRGCMRSGDVSLFECPPCPPGDMLRPDESVASEPDRGRLPDSISFDAVLIILFTTRSDSMSLLLEIRLVRGALWNSPPPCRGRRTSVRELERPRTAMWRERRRCAMASALRIRPTHSRSRRRCMCCAVRVSRLTFGFSCRAMTSFKLVRQSALSCFSIKAEISVKWSDKKSAM